MSFYVSRINFNRYLSRFSSRCLVKPHFHTQWLLKKQQMNVVALHNLYRSTHTGYVKQDTVNMPADSDLDLCEFNNAYEHVRKAISHTNDKTLVDAVNWSAKVLDYNVQGGKMYRGLTVLKAFKILSEDISQDRLLQASILGWCVELLQGFFLVTDDIMDNSVLRRGKPCWYKKPDVGLIAINDGLLLEHGVYKILEIYFEKHEAYNNIVQEFLQVTRKTVYGQCLDMLNAPPNSKPKFENFCLEKYHAIVEYKTSHYTFCLPVHLAMHLVGNFSEKEFQLSKKICLKLGLLFQIQDDYFDTFGDSKITGKIGTDIVDGKCTWFSASFFEISSESMKETMTENYGVDSEEAASKVMQMFRELNFEEKFHECENSLMREITLMIDNLSSDSLQILFNTLLKKIYQRKK